MLGLFNICVPDVSWYICIICIWGYNVRKTNGTLLGQ